MDSLIYIASDRIEILGYKKGSNPELLSYAKQPLNEGTIINGMITDPSELTEKLQKLKELKPQLFSDCNLVIDSTTLLIKKLPVPELKKQQYLNLVKDELSDLSESPDMIYDYSFIHFKGEPRIMLACATGKENLESYINVFKDAGITLRTARVGLETIIDYVRAKKELMQKTFVLNIVDGISMLSVIFEKGHYIFSTRTRLIGESREEYLTSVIQNLSSLLQFNKAQNFSPIEESCYVGLSAEDINTLHFLSVDNTVQIHDFDMFKTIRNGQIVTDACSFSFFGIFSTANSIDLLQSYKNAQKPLKEYKPFRPTKLIPYIVLLFLAASYAVVAWFTYQIEKDIEVINDYLYDPAVIAKVDEADELARINTILEQAHVQISEKVNELNLYPAISAKILTDITQTNSGTIQINSFEFKAETATIQITAVASSPEDSANYVENLKKSELINDITYTGYNYDNSGKFNFSCELLLNSNA